MMQGQRARQGTPLGGAASAARDSSRTPAEPNSSLGSGVDAGWHELRPDSRTVTIAPVALVGAQLGELLANALPVGMVGGRRGRHRRQGRGERHIAYGNDQTYPFLKRPKELQELRLVQDVQANALALTAVGANSFNSAAFTAAQLDNFTSCSAVFDQYRIYKIECIVQVQTLTEVTSGLNAGMMYTCIDTDDAGIPTTIGQVTAYNSCVMSSPTQFHYHCWEPRFIVATQDSGGATIQASTQTGWIDCAHPNVPHYGLKFAASATPLAAMNVIYMFRLHIGFRGLH